MQRKPSDSVSLETVNEIFGRFDPVALGVAIGSAAGLLVCSATAYLLLLGGEVVGPNLSLLGNYLLGYGMSWAGAALGTAEAAILGYVFGWVLGGTINLIIGMHESAFWFAATLE